MELATEQEWIFEENESKARAILQHFVSKGRLIIPIEQIKIWFEVLENAYQQYNDQRMELYLYLLSNCTDHKKEASLHVYSLIDYRPCEGIYYEPKSWRNDVNQALRKLYNINGIIFDLMSLKTQPATVLVTEVEEIFTDALYAMEPVQNNKISLDKYLSLFVELIELMFIVIDEYKEHKGAATEEMVKLISEFDSKIKHIADESNNELLYNSYSGVLGNIHRIYLALNSA